jgi:hypothetical protein
VKFVGEWLVPLRNYQNLSIRQKPIERQMLQKIFVGKTMNGCALSP